MKPSQIIVISDMHIGSKYGLCPTEGLHTDDTDIHPTSIQKKLHERHWLPFWEAMERETGGKAHLHINGDIVDGDWSRLAPHQITNIGLEQVKLAENLLMPLKSKYGTITAIRGTPTHVGQQGELEEKICEKLGTVRRGGLHTHWALRIQMSNDAIIDFKHHGSVSMPKHATGAAVDTAWQNCIIEHMKSKPDAKFTRPPDMCIRSHGHYYKCSGGGTYLAEERSLMTPAWQLMSPYGYKVASGRDSNINIGGLLLRVENGKVRVIDDYIWNIPNSRVISL